jgi:hypothetical protein
MVTPSKDLTSRHLRRLLKYPQLLSTRQRKRRRFLRHHLLKLRHLSLAHPLLRDKLSNYRIACSINVLQDRRFLHLHHSRHALRHDLLRVVGY